jgi:integrase/recombinase XerD
VERLKTADVLIVSLSQDQVRRLMDVPDRKTFTGIRDYTIMSLLLDTGLRLSEVKGLRTGDLHFNENYLKVMGKGAKERVVPLQGKLKKLLKEYLSYRGKLEHDTVFAGIDNNPITTRNIQNRLSIIAQKAGVTEIRTSPHTWRHTFARMYIVNGGDPFSLKKILGHNSWEMVHRYVNMFGGEVPAQHQKASPLSHLSDE